MMLVKAGGNECRVKEDINQGDNHIHGGIRFLPPIYDCLPCMPRHVSCLSLPGILEGGLLGLRTRAHISTHDAAADLSCSVIYSAAALVLPGQA
jgi:hypothetical protein